MQNLNINMELDIFVQGIFRIYSEKKWGFNK